MSQRLLFLFLLFFLFLLPLWQNVEAVGLYDVFEQSVTNTKTYSNPFDYTVIELRTSFKSPTGRNINFFGFHDGDGNGGQIGNVWKFRFMPDELGTWTYTYTWTDGTPGGNGSFMVTDTGLPGPLKVASDNPWFFENTRGQPFHFRGYDLHSFSESNLTSKIPEFTQALQTRVIDQGYNFTMWNGMTVRVATTGDSWWFTSTDTKTFDVRVWNTYEEFLSMMKDNNVYVITFAGFIKQGHQYPFTDFQVFLRYYVARFASFYNYFGWSPTWEWGDIWTADQVNQIMQFVYDNDPWKRLLSAHDHSNNLFTNWLGFSMRQQQSTNIFAGNIHGGGKQGGVGSNFINKPIIGSEDIWEYCNGGFGQPKDATQVRRGAWGIQMAGVMPLYSEWAPTAPCGGPGNGSGESEVKRMFDFYYSKVNYRKHQILNNTVVSSAAGQIASGIPGQEYLVYDEDGGSISINLSSVPSSTQFSVLWFDPTNGTTQMGIPITGGATRTLTSPFPLDTVLLLKTNRLSVLLTSYGQTGIQLAADLNGDGKVNSIDYIVYLML